MKHGPSAVSAAALGALGPPCDAVMSFIDALPWAAVALDECGLIVRVNRAMREHRGLGEEPCVGSLRDRFPEYHAALGGDRAWAVPNETEIRREGESGEVHERLIVRRTPGGACIFVEDVTRLRELQAADAQTARLASMGFLLAGACHEMSNPLAAVYSMVQLLRADPQADLPDVQKGLAHIAHNVHRMLEISQRLSGFSRVEREPGAVFAVDEAVEESLLLLRQSGQLDEIELVREADPAACVAGHQGELREVFHNILLNAVQAMDGRGRLEVRTARPVRGEVEVSIRDSGSGIAPKSLPRIFEPFFTTKPHGKGTGLGLSISRELVHHNGGRIRVENDAVRGACFFVDLPLAEARR